MAHESGRHICGAASHANPIPYLHQQSSGLLFKQHNQRKLNMMYQVTCAPYQPDHKTAATQLRQAGLSASWKQRRGG